MTLMPNYKEIVAQSDVKRAIITLFLAEKVYFAALPTRFFGLKT